jgi:hypothetical protein
MIKRLRELQNEYFSTQNKINSRPFARFSSPSGQLKPIAEAITEEAASASGVTNGQKEQTSDRTVNVDPVPSKEDKITVRQCDTDMPDSGFVSTPPLPQTPKLQRGFQQMNGSLTPSTPKTPTTTGSSGPSSTPVTPSRSARKSRGSLTPGLAGSKHFLEPTAQNHPKRRKVEEAEVEDCSSTSSSWAELEPNIIGQWQVFPVNLVTRQIFILRYLAPLGEYQEAWKNILESP